MFHETTIMIVTGDKLTDDSPFKNAVILITCLIKDDGKCYPQMFLEEAKHGNNTWLNWVTLTLIYLSIYLSI